MGKWETLGQRLMWVSIDKTPLVFTHSWMCINEQVNTHIQKTIIGPIML